MGWFRFVFDKSTHEEMSQGTDVEVQHAAGTDDVGDGVVSPSEPTLCTGCGTALCDVCGGCRVSTMDCWIWCSCPQWWSATFF